VAHLPLRAAGPSDRNFRHSAAGTSRVRVSGFAPPGPEANPWVSLSLGRRCLAFPPYWMPPRERDMLRLECSAWAARLRLPDPPEDGVVWLTSRLKALNSTQIPSC